MNLISPTGTVSRRISSPATGIYQVITVPFSLLFMAVLAVGVFMINAIGGCLVLAALVVNTVVYCKVILPLKRVWIEDDELIIEDLFLRCVRVRLAHIREVHHKVWSPRSVEIQFNVPTPFGWKVNFIPAGFVIFTPHPIVGELRELASAMRQLAPPESNGV